MKFVVDFAAFSFAHNSLTIVVVACEIEHFLKFKVEVSRVMYEY